MLRILSLAIALAFSAALPSEVMAHGYFGGYRDYGGGWHGHGWGHAWGYGGPGWRGGWARPYGYYGDDYYGGACWAWIGGARVWVC